MEAVSVKSSPTMIKQVLRRHFDHMCSIPVFASSTKVFIPENNLGNEGNYMWNMVKNYSSIRAFWQKDNRVGVRKGPDTADDYQYTFNVKLKNNAIQFDDMFFTTSPQYTVSQIKALAREQLERYHFEYDEPKKTSQNGKQHITGKIGVKEQDDLAIAILMGPYWAHYALKNKARLF